MVKSVALDAALDSGLSTPPLPAPVDIADLLEPFAIRGVDLGLHRLHAALAEAGHPERRFPAVQVAGTNGKGSIGSGCFRAWQTSPHTRALASSSCNKLTELSVRVRWSKTST